MIEKAVTALNEQKCVIFPSETVYGIGADAASDVGVELVYRLKKRPYHNPLILHVAHGEMAKNYVEWPDEAEICMDHFLPGPLTILLPKHKNCHKLSSHFTRDTLAIRIPSHPIAQKLLTSFARAIAAPSANLSGKVSATRKEHVAIFENEPHIPVILYDHNPPLGIESTILSLVDPKKPVILRKGRVLKEQIESVLDRPVSYYQTEKKENMIVPGMQKVHYSPNKDLYINQTKSHKECFFIGFGTIEGDCNLSKKGDLDEAAKNLYHFLIMADHSDKKTIAVAPIPQENVGIAINDRLNRAAIHKK